jgi:predicted transcriptional regulator
MPGVEDFGPDFDAKREEFLALLKDGEYTIPQTIRLMRQATGMTIPDYAKAVGVSTRYLGDIERGLMNPTIDILEKITEPFGLVVKLVAPE